MSLFESTAYKEDEINETPINYSLISTAIEESNLDNEIQSLATELNSDTETLNFSIEHEERLIGLYNKMSSGVANENDFETYSNDIIEIKSIATTFNYPLEGSISNEGSSISLHDVEKFLSAVRKAVMDLISKIIKNIKKIYIKIKTKIDNTDKKADELLKVIERISDITVPLSLVKEDKEKMVDLIGMMIYMNDNKVDDNLNSLLTTNFHYVSDTAGIFNSMANITNSISGGLTETLKAIDDNMPDETIMLKVMKLKIKYKKDWEELINSNNFYKKLSELLQDSLNGKDANLTSLLGMKKVNKYDYYDLLPYRFNGNTAKVVTLDAKEKDEARTPEIFKSFSYKLDTDAIIKKMDTKNEPSLQSLTALISVIKQYSKNTDEVYKGVMGNLDELEKTMKDDFKVLSEELSKADEDSLAEVSHIKHIYTKNTNFLVKAAMDTVLNTMYTYSSSLSYVNIFVNKYVKAENPE